METGKITLVHLEDGSTAKKFTPDSGSSDGFLVHGGPQFPSEGETLNDLAIRLFGSPIKDPRPPLVR